MRDLVDDRPGIVAAVIEHDDHRERIASDRLRRQCLKACADPVRLVARRDDDDRVHADRLTAFAARSRSRSSFLSDHLGEGPVDERGAAGCARAAPWFQKNPERRPRLAASGDEGLVDRLGTRRRISKT
jgi:hypothetical protein